MKLCSVEGCDKKHVARGYCRLHYSKALRCGEFITNKYNLINKCCVDGCTRKYYAKNYCRNHYSKYISNDFRVHMDNRCMATDCNTNSADIFCARHMRQYYHSNARKGEYNCNWNGGSSEYKNHSLMKKLRILKLKSNNHTCEICGGQATEIHHLDKDKSHHELNNFIAVCHKCHFRTFHRQDVGRPRKVINE